MNTEGNSALVSACGLYCGACHKYIKGSCPGCAGNEKARWCKVRSCTRDAGYHTCAECPEYSDVDECRKFNTFMSKLFSFIFKSDRKASLRLISEIGVGKYAHEMADKKMVVLKRGKRANR